MSVRNIRVKYVKKGIKPIGWDLIKWYLVIKLQNDWIHGSQSFWQSGSHISPIIKLIESIVATGAKLRSFSWLASSAGQGKITAPLSTNVNILSAFHRLSATSQPAGTMLSVESTLRKAESGAINLPGPFIGQRDVIKDTTVARRS
jgi:hypothetical protein